MKILVTNDDGITAPGLKALANAMKSFGDVVVVAPDKNWSVSGHSKTLRNPLRAKKINFDGDVPAYAIDGTPSDCVVLAHLGLVKGPIDFVVSGINPYANLGNDLTYSGTVTAAMEAVIWGIHAVAFSIDGDDSESDTLNYQTAGLVAQKIVTKVLGNKLSKDILLCVNIPDMSYEDIQGYKITRQGKRIYKDVLITRQDPKGKPYHWIGGDPPGGISEEGTDIGELSQGYVTITPIQLDLTSYEGIKELKSWQW